MALSGNLSMVPPNVEPPSFAYICQQIADELAASNWQLKIADPRYRAFLAALFRDALVEDEDD